ncbi:MAG: F0F1 ATP synthase subunit B' [Candidatus Puniceispirillum sp.]|jgi:F-type H+-transporting ATPase subunit b|uniref:F0F1 ATP synthase subunit B family protein n=1 Tax=Candidatus Puniceispirillum sp. TaxID=2026719 RepID=UPI001EC42671|nr:F0F1 ATP synthase subunit B' [Candidatus Puniceispirillum sp.]MBT6415409.1 F0F1 ATP synthase subunit B' [Candidatus Puniceispirillum sp.]MBT6565412.1 F0F1 ATP synthase subunit B' [Candidatus Puniceispirillum sp.]
MKNQCKIWTSISAVSIMSVIVKPALAADAAKPGLPQLDVTTWPSQIFWLIVLFAVGYVIMSRIVTPRIGTVLEERRKRLDDDLAKAREASEDAAKIRAGYEETLEIARTEAAAFAKDAAVKATQSVEAANAKLSKKLATKAQAAEAKLAKARAEAMENLNAVAVDAAIAATQHLTGIKATKAQAEKTVKSLAKTITPQESN